jgi:hypothetical protein
MQMPVLRNLAAVVSLSFAIGASDPEDRPMPLARLQNMDYRYEWASGSVAHLRNGRFDDRPYLPDHDYHLAVTMGDVVGFGDVDGDGRPDAAVILIADTGGVGMFYRLAVVLDVDGKPQHVASACLGDRVEVHKIDIKDWIISVDLNVQGPRDYATEHTLHVVWRFVLKGKDLVQLPT